MRRFLATLGILLVMSFALSGLDLQVPDALQPAWGRLLSRHPLPDGITGGAVIVREGRTDAPGFALVEKTLVAAVARLWDDPAPVTRQMAESGKVRRVPLEEVTLPDIAVPVDGLLPGDPGYPLERRVEVGIRGDDPMLLRWFLSLPGPEPFPAERIRWIGAVGDVMPARGVDAVLGAPGGAQRVFGDTLPILRGLDLLAGNLEAAATRGGERIEKSFTFRFDPLALDILADVGFSYLSLSNNHTFDFGKQGFIDSLANLARAGIATSGAGLTITDASRPAVLNAGGTEIRILSFGAYSVDRAGFDGRTRARATADEPGTLWLDDEGLRAAAAGFSPHSFNIALVHGGVEWSAAPTAQQKRQYADLLRAGADLVIGSHPHLLQGLEARDGRLIAYSLGDFLFPGMEGTGGGDRSVILEVGIAANRIVSLRIVPVRLFGGTVRLDPGGETPRMLRSLCRPLNAWP